MKRSGVSEHVERGVRHHAACRRFQRPGGLVYRTVDKLSGKLQTEYCPLDAIYTEVYLPGTEPVEECDLHQPTPWGVPIPTRTDSSRPPPRR